MRPWWKTPTAADITAAALTIEPAPAVDWQCARPRPTPPPVIIDDVPRPALMAGAILAAIERDERRALEAYRRSLTHYVPPAWPPPDPLFSRWPRGWVEGNVWPYPNGRQPLEAPR